MILYNEFDILGLGFAIGFAIVLISYVIACFTGQRIPSIRKSLLIISAVLVIIYTPPVQPLSKIWLFLSLLLCAFIINNLLELLHRLGVTFYNKQLEIHHLKKTEQIVYLSAILLAIGLIASGSIRAILLVYSLTKQIILFGLGFWLALKLLVQKKSNQME